jgi:hypothetical protein
MEIDYIRWKAAKKTKSGLLILLFLGLSAFAYAEWNGLSKGQADTLYCSIPACGNVSLINITINQSLADYYTKAQYWDNATGSFYGIDNPEHFINNTNLSSYNTTEENNEIYARLSGGNNLTGNQNVDGNINLTEHNLTNVNAIIGRNVSYVEFEADGDFGGWG